MLNIALPKGRMGDVVYTLFAENGYVGNHREHGDRKLIITAEEEDIRFFLVKPSDVPVYVEKGVADIGIAGKDTLLECQADVYELLDLGVENCKMAVAGPRDYIEDTSKTLKIATKYPTIAKNYYQGKNCAIEVIKLNGSIELAPILGLSDLIVDIVETGNTLKANGLEVLEEIMPISARLIANKSSYKFKNAAIDNLKVKLERSVKR